MDNNFDNIEEEDVGENREKYPFNPNNIKVRMDSVPIYSMCERIKHNEIDLNTQFQRKEGLWTDTQQSLLIESILIKFPIPVFYFDGSEPSNWLVIDGLQRLSSLKRFLVVTDEKEKLNLTGLEFLKDLEGKCWEELKRHHQRQILETSLQCYILEGSEDNVKFNIFKRINTGGLNLSNQEIRHAMHQDVANFLKTLAESKEFLDATEKRISPERMLDREFVNRFLAFYIFDHKEEYTPQDDLDTFMNRALDKVATLSESEKNDLETRFKAAMVLAKNIFNEYAFCKSFDRKQINKALFEVMSVSFAKLDDDERKILLSRKEDFKERFYYAVKNEFQHFLTAGGKPSITSRHNIFNNLVKNTLNN